MVIYIIMFGIMILGALVQLNLKRKFAKYSKVTLDSGYTGKEVAEMMLRQNGIHDVSVVHVPGQLTDHFDPTKRTVNLSDEVYFSNSVAAAAVAAHECGHAVQHAYGYAPLKLRSAMVPIVSFSSSIVQWVLIAGILLVQTFPALLMIGIILFATITIFSFVTLPVEVDASRRALVWLKSANITSSQQAPMAYDALKSAAYTYVVAAIGSLATLLYYIAILQRRS